jgi:cephalosporin hydroxylase
MAMTIGGFAVDRDQPPLSAPDQEVVRRFHQLYYQRWLSGGDTINLSWFGYQTLKCPLDLWIYQELLVRTMPDFVVECGTYLGGSALYLAMILDLVGHGEVITIDADRGAVRPEHPRLTYLTGSSVDPFVVQAVSQRTGNGRAMVILDSDHRQAHVLAEMRAYAPLVQEGDYLVVEDTNVNGHPVWPGFGPGPMEAVDQFLSESDEFIRDRRCERLLLTLQPGGWLRRTKPAARPDGPSTPHSGSAPA